MTEVSFLIRERHTTRIWSSQTSADIQSRHHMPLPNTNTHLTSSDMAPIHKGRPRLSRSERESSVWMSGSVTPIESRFEPHLPFSLRDPPFLQAPLFTPGSFSTAGKRTSNLCHRLPFGEECVTDCGGVVLKTKRFSCAAVFCHVQMSSRRDYFPLLSPSPPPLSTHLIPHPPFSLRKRHLHCFTYLAS